MFELGMLFARSQMISSLVAHFLKESEKEGLKFPDNASSLSGRVQVAKDLDSIFEKIMISIAWRAHDVDKAWGSQKSLELEPMRDYTVLPDEYMVVMCS